MRSALIAVVVVRSVWGFRRQKLRNKVTKATGMSCPPTPKWVWPVAGMRITTVAATTCDMLKEEIKARIDGQSRNAESPWHDPHNNGTYMLKHNTDTLLLTSRLTGDGKYTDEQIFTLTPIRFSIGDNCQIEACSRSQVRSINDFGTNYCNLKMLFCGRVDGCKPVIDDFTVSPEKTEQFAGSTVNLTACGVNAKWRALEALKIK